MLSNFASIGNFITFPFDSFSLAGIKDQTSQDKQDKCLLGNAKINADDYLKNAIKHDLRL